ncbi:MAG: diacylglycerol kinase [Beijerinckiaceae bacterium]
MKRIVAAFFNSMRAFGRAARTETAVRQELVGLGVALVLAPLIANGLWQFILLISVVLLLLCVEILNTAVEKLCDHVTPDWHDAIRYIKDLGSAAVFCMLVIVAMVWGTMMIQNLILRGP